MRSLVALTAVITVLVTTGVRAEESQLPLLTKALKGKDEKAQIKAVQTLGEMGLVEMRDEVRCSPTKVNVRSIGAEGEGEIARDGYRNFENVESRSRLRFHQG